jgi:hypothetical protein
MPSNHGAEFCTWHNAGEPANAEKVRSLGWCGRNLRVLAQGGNLPTTKAAVATILSHGVIEI